MNVLNPVLYRALRGRFKEVKISNEGQRMLVQKLRDPYDPKKYKDVILEAGEYYRVNCPNCADTRYRLYVNHAWNTKTRKGKSFGRHLIYCFNESCDMRAFPDQLQLYLVGKPVVDRSFVADVQQAVHFKPVDLPGLCLPLDQLPAAHPANAYLLSRRFDPGQVSKEWGVHYCQSCAEDEYGFVPGTKALARMVRGRIIIPIYRAGQMVGYQARAVGDHQVKYYTMPGLHKQHLIYNGDRAKTYDFGVVVEGVTDAWRVGFQAGALLGKNMSWKQRELILAYWGSGALCVLLDPDAVKETERMQRILNPRSFRWGAFCLPLPGKDPGDMDHETLWGLIASYARSRSIQITAG